MLSLEKLTALEERFITYWVEHVTKWQHEYARLDFDHENLLCALELAQKRRLETKYFNLVSGLSPYWMMRGLYCHAKHHYVQLQQFALKSENETLLFESLYGLAKTLHQQGYYLKFYKIAQQCLNLPLDKLSEVKVLNMLGVGCLSVLDDSQQAQSYFQKAIEKATAYDETLAVASLSNLAMARQNLGEFDVAEEYYQRCIQILQRHKLYTKREEARFALNLGTLMFKQHKLIKSEEYWLQALKVAEEIQYEAMVALASASLAELATYQESYQTTENYALQGYDVAKSIEHWAFAGLNGIQLAYVAIAKKDWHRAKAFIDEALKWAQEAGNPVRISATLSVQGKMYLAQSDRMAAKKLFESMQENPKFNQVDAWYGLAQVAQLEGQYAQANTLAEKALQVCPPAQKHKRLEIQTWRAKVNQVVAIQCT